MVSQKLIKELKYIIKEEYGRDLSLQDTTKIANGLVGYYDMLAKINYRNRTKKT